MPPPSQTRVLFGLSPLLGRLTELSGFGASAVMTEAIALVVEAQRAGMPVAWVAAGPGLFYPPDAAAAGVDLGALAVVRAGVCAGEDARPKTGPRDRRDARPTGEGMWGGRSDRPTLKEALRAVDLLLRSGGFGLVVLDLIDQGPRARLGDGVQARLAGLARRHHAAVVCLTHRPENAPALGPLIAVRAIATRHRLEPGHFTCSVRPLRAKGVLLEARQEIRHGPDGLR